MFDEIQRAVQEQVTKASGRIILGSIRADVQEGVFAPFEPVSTVRTFVDGGNAVLLSAPGWCLAQIRVAAVIFDGVYCKSRIKEDFFVLIRAENERPLYVAKMFNTSFTCGPFDGLHKDLRNGQYPATPERIVSLVRRLAEIDLALRVGRGVVVLDGESTAQTAFEDLPLQALEQQTRTIQGLLVGVCKTSQALSETGAGGLTAIASAGPAGRWVWLPTGFAAVARLHARAEHVFMIQCSSEARLTAVQALAFDADDPVLPGYPYGLICADALARVSELESLNGQLRFLSILGFDARRSITAIDAHNYF